MNREIAKLDFPPAGEFLRLSRDSGTALYACEISVDMMNLAKDDMFCDGIRGAMEFLDRAEGA